MKKTLSCLFACLAALPLPAQYEKILADPTVSWAAEIELVLAPDAIYDEWPFDSLNASTVLKTVNTAPDDPRFEPPGLPERLFAKAINGDWPAFADGGLTQRLTREDCLRRTSRVDTVVTFDPETYEERIMIVRNDFNGRDCPLVCVRQLLFYRQKTAEFGLVTRAIAPALRDGSPVFWLPVPAVLKRGNNPKLADPDITWARRLRTKGATPDVAVRHSLKRPELPLLRSFLHRVRTDPDLPLLDPEDWRLSPFEDRETLLGLNRTDTVVTFDPETYAENIQVVHSELDIESLRHLRLVQDWYWDERRQQLIVRLAAVAPMVDVLDTNGNFRYSRPLFYRKIK